MKRILAIILSLTLFIGSAIPAMAAVNENTVSPHYTYISKLQTSLSISEPLGISTCTASCRTSGTGSVKLVCRLQQYNGTYWSTIKAWTVTGTQYANIAKNFAVYSGYKYRTYTSCYVYNSAGSLVESGACYSSQVTY